MTTALGSDTTFFGVRDNKNDLSLGQNYTTIAIANDWDFVIMQTYFID